MREILFHGKRVDNGEWVEGFFVRSNTGKCWICTSNNELHFAYVEVIPETVCQFTGFNDKNGNRIFEGDIVIIPDYRRGIFITGKQPVRKQVMIYGNGFHGANFGGEIIGNIHDNPELF